MGTGAATTIPPRGEMRMLNLPKMVPLGNFQTGTVQFSQTALKGSRAEAPQDCPCVVAGRSSVLTGFGGLFMAPKPGRFGVWGCAGAAIESLNNLFLMSPCPTPSPGGREHSLAWFNISSTHSTGQKCKIWLNVTPASRGVDLV